jgi:hypothetical protein
MQTTQNIKYKMCYEYIAIKFVNNVPNVYVYVFVKKTVRQGRKEAQCMSSL